MVVRQGAPVVRAMVDTALPTCQVGLRFQQLDHLDSTCGQYFWLGEGLGGNWEILSCLNAGTMLFIFIMLLHHQVRSSEYSGNP